MSNDISSDFSQDKSKKVKKGPKIILLLILLLLMLMIVAAIVLVVWYSSIDVTQDGSYQHEYDTFDKKIGALLYKYKCERQDRIYYESGWSTLLCYRRSSDAGKECIQNSDCQAGVCKPSAIPTKSHIGLTYYDGWRGTPEVNDDGYVVGHCSEAALRFDPNFGGTCLSSYIFKSSTIDDPSGISEGASCN